MDPFGDFEEILNQTSTSTATASSKPARPKTADARKLKKASWRKFTTKREETRDTNESNNNNEYYEGEGDEDEFEQLEREIEDFERKTGGDSGARGGDDDRERNNAIGASGPGQYLETLSEVSEELSFDWHEDTVPRDTGPARVEPSASPAAASTTPPARPSGDQLSGRDTGGGSSQAARAPSQWDSETTQDGPADYDDNSQDEDRPLRLNSVVNLVSELSVSSGGGSSEGAGQLSSDGAKGPLDANSEQDQQVVVEKEHKLEMEQTKSRNAPVETKDGRRRDEKREIGRNSLQSPSGARQANGRHELKARDQVAGGVSSSRLISYDQTGEKLNKQQQEEKRAQVPGAIRVQEERRRKEETARQSDDETDNGETRGRLLASTTNANYATTKRASMAGGVGQLAVDGLPRREGRQQREMSKTDADEDSRGQDHDADADEVGIGAEREVEKLAGRLDGGHYQMVQSETVAVRDDHKELGLRHPDSDAPLARRDWHQAGSRTTTAAAAHKSSGDLDGQSLAINMLASGAGAGGNLIMELDKRFQLLLGQVLQLGQLFVVRQSSQSEWKQEEQQHRFPPGPIGLAAAAVGSCKTVFGDKSSTAAAATDGITCWCCHEACHLRGTSLRRATLRGQADVLETNGTTSTTTGEGNWNSAVQADEGKARGYFKMSAGPFAVHNNRHNRQNCQIPSGESGGDQQAVWPSRQGRAAPLLHGHQFHQNERPPAPQPEMAPQPTVSASAATSTDKETCGRQPTHQEHAADQPTSRPPSCWRHEGQLEQTIGDLILSILNNKLLVMKSGAASSSGGETGAAPGCDIGRGSGDGGEPGPNGTEGVLASGSVAATTTTAATTATRIATKQTGANEPQTELADATKTRPAETQTVRTPPPLVPLGVELVANMSPQHGQLGGGQHDEFQQLARYYETRLAKLKAEIQLEALEHKQDEQQQLHDYRMGNMGQLWDSLTTNRPRSAECNVKYSSLSSGHNLRPTTTTGPMRSAAAPMSGNSSGSGKRRHYALPHFDTSDGRRRACASLQRVSLQAKCSSLLNEIHFASSRLNRMRSIG